MTTDRQLLASLRSGHWPTLIGAWLHFEISFMVWLLYGALGALIGGELGLTATEKGVLVAVPLLGGAFLRIPVGIWSDRWGPKRIGVALMVLEAVALLAGWLGARSYAELLLVGVLLGAAGASFAMAIPLATHAYPDRARGLAMGIAASANSGTVLAVLLAPRLAVQVGWHQVFGLMLLPVLVVTGLFVMLVQDHRPLSDTGGPLQEFRSIFRQKSVYWLCLLYAVTFGGFVGLSSYLPLLFHDHYGLDLITAGSLTAGCSLLGSLIRPVGGYVADRIGSGTVLQAVFLLVSAVVVLAAQSPPLASMAVVMLTLVGLLGFGNGVVFKMVSERFAGCIGAASGLIGAAGSIGGFFLPVLLGACRDFTGSYRGGFLVFAVVSLAAGLSVTKMMSRQRASLGNMTLPERSVSR